MYGLVCSHLLIVKKYHGCVVISPYIYAMDVFRVLVSVETGYASD